MKPLRARAAVVGCLVVSVASSGCSSKAAGDVAAQILIGLAAVVVKAAVDGGLKGGSAGHDSARSLTDCEKRRLEWREIHQDPAEPLPAHLQCTAGGDWPDEEGLPASAVARDGGRERTPVPMSVCGGTETERQRCEEQRALREQRDKDRALRGQW